MRRKTICSIVRIVEMVFALSVLRETYQIGALGYFMVMLTGMVWAVTACIEQDK